MYLKQFVSDILNIDFEQIQELQDICQSDETIVIKIKLNLNCNKKLHTFLKKVGQAA